MNQQSLVSYSPRAACTMRLVAGSDQSFAGAWAAPSVSGGPIGPSILLRQHPQPGVGWASRDASTSRVTRVRGFRFELGAHRAWLSVIVCSASDGPTQSIHHHIVDGSVT